jgi:hypothetical protein
MNNTLLNNDLSVKNTLGFEIPPYNPEVLLDVKSSFRRFKNTDMVKTEIIPGKLKANNIPTSFNNKFLKPLNRTLYYRTIKQNYIEALSTEEAENLYFTYLEKNMPNIENHELYKRSLNGFSNTFVSMSNRTFNYTRAFVTHCVKNTFVTIFRGHEHLGDNYNMKVLAKVSSGLIGYKGPKKSTIFARKGVIKEAGKILSSNMTSLLDVIFTSKVSRWNRKSVRDLCPNLSYILNIFINYNRPHGYIKQKNKRRV